MSMGILSYLRPQYFPAPARSPDAASEGRIPAERTTRPTSQPKPPPPDLAKGETISLYG
jgi:hypothetical protein